MLPDSLDSSAEDKRKARRQKTLRSGKIIFNDKQCSVDCSILDLSDLGARLRPVDVSSCPDVFTLKISHGPAHECEVVHRFKDTLGVKFLT